jgi:hypothetical protein
MAWQKLLFSERTPYQLVEIYLTLDFGAVLVLDGYTNLAESDLAYTQALMCHGVQVLAGKEKEKENKWEMRRLHWLHSCCPGLQGKGCPDTRRWRRRPAARAAQGEA